MLELLCAQKQVVGAQVSRRLVSQSFDLRELKLQLNGRNHAFGEPVLQRESSLRSPSKRSAQVRAGRCVLTSNPCGWDAGGLTDGVDKLLYCFEKCVIDTGQRELRREAALIPLEPKVVNLLVYLIAHRDRVISKDDLLASIWGGRIVSDSALSTRINAARSAIGDTGEEQRLIKTLPRIGVRFVGNVREEHAPTHAVAADVLVETPNRPLTLPDRPSIAVLPFINISGDSEQDYFADGMAQEIITALSRCAWLFVIARNSSFTYRGRTVDVRQVGRELGVRYVIEGSVRRSGSRLRFTGQLIDATTGAHLWADRFDGDLSDVFALQDRFTENVVAAIAPQLQLAEIERLRHKPAAHLDAYDLLLRAQQLEYEFSPDSLAAIENVKRALAIDPSYAPAMALGAYCYTERNTQGWAQRPTEEGIEGARLASRAVELGKSDGNVLRMCALAVCVLAMDARRAKEIASLSLAINPNSAMALTTLAFIENGSGNPAKGLELLLRAERVSPRDPRAWLTATGVAVAHYFEDRFVEAVVWARKALIQNPRHAIALRMLAASLARQGEVDEAAAVLRKNLDIEPGLTLSALRARMMYLDDRCWNRYALGLRAAELRE
jgi:TolB-like protein